VERRGWRRTVCRNSRGNYVGREGLLSLLAKLGERSGGTFQIQPVAVQWDGDELVVA
jgi:hypothetical protein